jgi:hypothetical protein
VRQRVEGLNFEETTTTAAIQQGRMTRSQHEVARQRSARFGPLTAWPGMCDNQLR